MSDLMTLAPAVAGGETGAKKRPKLELSEDAKRGTMAAIGVSVTIIAAVAFALSFLSVMRAMQPFFGAASWAVPILLDVAIAALTLISIGLELNELSGRGARLFSRLLVGYTIWANAQDAHTWVGRGAHCLPPIVFVGMVTIVEGAVRRLVGLSSETRMDKVRTSRWLLAPLATFRLWRRMRLWEITSYKTAVDRTQQQSASRALLREWHGKSWRRSAPRAERLAVRLQSATERPVAELLTESAESIVSAARAAVRPLSPEELAAKVAAMAQDQVPTPELTRSPTRTALRTRRVVRARARKAARVTSPAMTAKAGKVPTRKPAVAASAGRRKVSAPLPDPIVRRTDEELLTEGRRINALVMAETSAPAGASRFKTELGIGQRRAQWVRDTLAAEVTSPAPAEAPAEVTPLVLVAPTANGAQVALPA